jgi:hypothetical protein
MEAGGAKSKRRRRQQAVVRNGKKRRCFFRGRRAVLEVQRRVSRDGVRVFGPWCSGCLLVLPLPLVLRLRGEWAERLEFESLASGEPSGFLELLREGCAMGPAVYRPGGLTSKGFQVADVDSKGHDR